jgi:hypothetical protein
MAGFSPSDAALEGFRLTRERPLTILAWSFLYFGGILLIAGAMMVTLGPKFIELAKKGQFSPQDMEAVGGLLAESWPAFILVLLMTVLLMSIVMGGIYRLVLRPEERGFAHLRVGSDELRLAAVNLMFVVVYVLFLVSGLVVMAAASQGGALGVFLAGVGILAGTLWIGVRLALITPMTFDLRRIAIGPAWELSRGRFWSLLGMTLLAVIFYLMVWILISVIAVAVIELSGGEAALADLSILSPTALIAFGLTLTMQLLLQILQIVMIYAPFAVAYRTLKGDAA